MENTVIELFAGIGGFRVGFNHVSSIGLIGEGIENENWNFLWANQWEPSRKKQCAYECYVARFGQGSCINEDICGVDCDTIPEHSVLTAGFPFKETSEENSSKMWREILRVIDSKNTPFLVLENIDKLLISPSSKRGNDFGYILRTLCDRGYAIQWRTVNGADYGHPQRRKRVLIFAFKNTTKYYNEFEKRCSKGSERTVSKELLFSSCFPCSKRGELVNTSVYGPKYKTEDDVKASFEFSFCNAGYCIGGYIATMSVASAYHKKKASLGDCLANVREIPESCYDVDVEKVQYLKGAKKINRTAKNGHEYVFSEGAIPFPDDLSKPSRTILPNEGSTSRMSHFVLDPRTGKYRKLAPIECEMLNEFPPYWTETGMSENQRYSVIGDSMICGLAETIGDALKTIVENE